MLTYREYFNRMRTICSAFNDALGNVPVVNITGLTDQENLLYKAGLYVMALCKSEGSVFSQESVGVLIHLCKSVNGSFEFGMFPPEDVESEEEYEDEWRIRFNNYSRMCKQIFIGTCFSFDPLIENGHSDISFWCQQQAEHIADYCVSHNLDCELLNMLKRN